MYCMKCQYNLRGLQESRCPECGTSFDPNDAATFLKALPPDKTWERVTDVIKWSLLAGLAAVVARGIYRWFAYGLHH